MALEHESLDQVLVALAKKAYQIDLKPQDIESFVAESLQATPAWIPAAVDHLRRSLSPDSNASSSGERVESPVVVKDARTHGTSLDQIGPFRLDELIEKGGMGIVYAATDMRTATKVALKIPQGVSSGFSARFQKEFASLTEMNHPRIVRPIEYGVREDGQIYFAMEFIPDAKNVIEYANAQELSLRQRADLFQKVLEGVSVAHIRGIVHRDLKASNIIVAHANTKLGEPKIVDFGLAVQGGEGLPLGRGGSGTPDYLAPEVQNGAPPGFASDIYALGKILGKLVSPPSGKRLQGVLAKELAAIAGRASHQTPEARYPSVDAFREDLRRILESQPVAAETRVGLIAYRPRRAVWRNRYALAVTSVLVFGLAGTLWQLNRVEQQRQRANAAVAAATAVDLFDRSSSNQALLGAIEALKRSPTLTNQRALLRVMNGMATPIRIERRAGGVPRFDPNRRWTVDITAKGRLCMRPLGPDSSNDRCVLRLESVAEFQQLGFSGNGEVFGAADSAGIVRRWKTADWTPLPSVDVKAPITALQLSRDGNHLLTVLSTNKKTFSLWSADPAQRLLELPADSADLKKFALSPDAHFVYDVRGGEFETIDLSSGTRRTQLLASDGKEIAEQLVLAPSGQRVAIQLHDPATIGSRIVVADVDPAGRLGTITQLDPSPFASLTAVRFSDSGYSFAAADSLRGVVFIWRPPEKRPVWQLDAPEVQGVQFASQYEKGILTWGEHTVRYFLPTPQGMKESKRVEHDSDVIVADYDEKRGEIVSADLETVRVSSVGLAEGIEPAGIDFWQKGGEVMGGSMPKMFRPILEFTPDSKLILSLVGRGELLGLPSDSQPFYLTYAATGKSAYSGTVSAVFTLALRNDVVVVSDESDGSSTQRRPHECSVISIAGRKLGAFECFGNNALAVHPTRPLVATLDFSAAIEGQRSPLSVYNWATRASISVSSVPIPVAPAALVAGHSMAFSADGRLLGIAFPLTNTGESQLILVDANSWRVIGRSVLKGVPQRVTFSKNGAFVVVVSDGGLFVWRTSDLKMTAAHPTPPFLGLLDPARLPIADFTLSGNEALMVRATLAGTHGVVARLNLATGDVRNQPFENASQTLINTSAISPDGSLLAVSSAFDRTWIELFDLNTSVLLGKFPVDRTVDKIAISPDDQRLAVLTHGREPYVIDISFDATIARACKLAPRNLSDEEWARLFPGEKPSKSCPNIPEVTLKAIDGASNPKG